MGSATTVEAGLRIARGVSLPIDYVTKTAAILAQRRKGKTYTAAVIAEELCRLQLPWVALDPTGAWWGLRASADGEKAGLPVVVFGGQHGDLPLERDGGAIIADIVLEHPGWYVLDLSLLESRAAERDFSLAFAQRLYRRKMQPGMDFPLHLFVDEADLFVPQERETGQDNLVLGAFQSIVRRGGLHGLGATLISQRPALVNKSALTQLDMLILLRLVAGQDQEAIYKDYVKRHGTKEQQRALMDSLASLPVGTAWLWEPGAEPPLFERVKIRQRNTFNSSATPKAGEARVEPKVLASVDLDAVRERMVGAIERARLEDPTALRRALAEERQARAEAERTLAEAKPGSPSAHPEWETYFREAGWHHPDECEPARIEVPAVSDEMITAAREIVDIASDTEIALRRTVDSLRDAVLPLQPLTYEQTLPVGSAVLDDFHASSVERSAAGIVADARRDRPTPAPESAPAPPPEADGGELGTGARNLLDVLVAHHPLRLTYGQVALLAGRKARGGAWNTALKQLRTGGYIAEDPAGGVSLTDYATTALGVATVKLSPAEQRERWRQALPVAAREIFDLLVTAHPNPIETERLAATTGRAARGGSWNTAIATLTRNGLAAKVGTALVATPEAIGG